MASVGGPLSSTQAEFTTFQGSELAATLPGAFVLEVRARSCSPGLCVCNLEVTLVQP